MGTRILRSIGRCIVIMFERASGRPQQAPLSSSQSSISPRFGHSMVLDPLTHTLFIFAGQRDDKYFSDMYAYDVTSNTMTELFSNFSTSGGPDACFTQRAVIDAGLRGIYVFSGLTRAQPSSALTVLRSDSPNWVYQYTQPSEPGKWTQIPREPEPESRVGDDGEPSEGVYAWGERGGGGVDEEMKAKVVMAAGEGNGGGGNARTGGEGEGDGGNGGGSGSGGVEEERPRVRKMRLDDFWVMKLIRAAPDEVIQQVKYQIRRQMFREMCEEQPAVKALRYLQTDVPEVVDHNNPEETSIFRSLLTHLLAPATPLVIDDPSVTSRDVVELHEPPKKCSRPNTPHEAWTDVSRILRCGCFTRLTRGSFALTLGCRIIPATAHAAFDKGAPHMGVKVHMVPVDPVTRKVDLKRVRRAINCNTILLAGSAIDFPDGNQDDIVALGKLAAK
ncbi:hypothetical protein PAXINDRAFT_179243 [Paxillus involutus ATCC 200175]|nr:hypothetical protein PAXINDRAFT_179243 [Paxillus involutus ATCC 200175]